MTLAQLLALILPAIEPMIAQAIQSGETSVVNPAIDKLVAQVTSPPEAVAALKDFAPALEKFVADLAAIELGRLAALAPKASS